MDHCLREIVSWMSETQKEQFMKSPEMKHIDTFFGWKRKISDLQVDVDMIKAPMSILLNFLITPFLRICAPGIIDGTYGQEIIDGNTFDQGRNSERDLIIWCLDDFNVYYQFEAKVRNLDLEQELKLGITGIIDIGKHRGSAESQWREELSNSDLEESVKEDIKGVLDIV